MGRQAQARGGLLIGTDHKVSAMCHLMRDRKQGQRDVGLQLPVTRPERCQAGGGRRTGEVEPSRRVLTDTQLHISHRGGRVMGDTERLQSASCDLKRQRSLYVCRHI